MRPGWGLLGLLAAGLLGLRLAAYALIDGRAAALAHDLCRWDCLWYVHTAMAGYDRAPIISTFDYSMANWAFLPLYPLLMRGLIAAGLGGATAGFLLANLCLLGFMLLGYAYLARLRERPDPLLFFGFLLAFPYGFYLSLPYTESLYALLATGALLALRRGPNGMAACLISLLGVTRVTGIVLLPALTWRLFTPAWRQLRRGQARQAALTAADALLPLGIAALGLSLFMAYLYLHVGDALGFLHIQAGWQRHFQDPFYILAKGLMALGMPGFSLAERLHSAGLALAACLGLALAVWTARRGQGMEAWFLAATVLLAASSSLVSLQRYTLANPVFLLSLFRFLSEGGRRRYLPWFILACIPAQYWFLRHWLANGADLV